MTAQCRPRRSRQARGRRQRNRLRVAARQGVMRLDLGGVRMSKGVTAVLRGTPLYSATVPAQATGRGRIA